MHNAAFGRKQIFRPYALNMDEGALARTDNRCCKADNGSKSASAYMAKEARLERLRQGPFPGSPSLRSRKRAGGPVPFFFFLSVHRNEFEQFVRRGVSKSRIVLKNEKPPRVHFPTGSRVVMIEHIFQSVPEEVEISFEKPVCLARFVEM